MYRKTIFLLSLKVVPFLLFFFFFSAGREYVTSLVDILDSHVTFLLKEYNVTLRIFSVLLREFEFIISDRMYLS